MVRNMFYTLSTGGQSYCSVFTIVSNCSDNNMHSSSAIGLTISLSSMYMLLADVAWQQSLLIGKTSASPPHGH